jgi:hypothetical protein
MAPRVEVVDMQTLSRVRTIALSKYVTMTSYDSIADRLACVIDNPYEVAFIDCASDSVVAIIPVPGYPASIVRSAHRRLYLANQGASSFSVILDTTTVGIAETMTDKRGTVNPGPSILRGVLFLPVSPFTIHTSLFDMTGRQVMALAPGANDVRSLAPGVYFVREPQAQAQAQAVRKVIITR